MHLVVAVHLVVVVHLGNHKHSEGEVLSAAASRGNQLLPPKPGIAQVPSDTSVQVFFADTDGLQGSEASKLAGEFQGRDQAG